MLRSNQNESNRSCARLLRFRSALVTLAAFAAFGALAVVAACGPSVQSIYEGNVRFEHCYRLDLEVDTAPTHREACWKEWIGVYTYGQPRDRIEYARRRVHAFASGDTSRPMLDIGDAKKTEARQFYLVVPAPTNGHAPPPQIATPWHGDGGSPAPAPSTEPPKAPGDDCGDSCRDTYTDCSRPCAADAGKPDPSCKACDLDYKACMKRCFR